MSRTLRLGLRLALGGGREGLVRLVFMAVGVGVAVALLLLALTPPGALWGRFERAMWTGAAYAALSPETEDDPVVESADGALFLAVSDYYDGGPMLRVYLAALGEDPPVPPGLDRAPGPGEVAASPAMRALLESTPDDELDDRYPGRVTMTIGPQGLAHDNELVAIIGRTPDQLRGVRSVGEIHGFGREIGSSLVLVGLVAVFGLTGALVVLVPIVILIVVVTRVAWRQRERRLAAIRLVGATQPQIAMVAAAEAALAATGGAALGWALYEVGRRILAATLIFQGGHFWVDDVAVPGRVLAGILLGTPALVLLTTLLSLRHVRARPLSVDRRARRRRPSLWLVLPLVIGLGGQFAVLPFQGRLMQTDPSQSSPYTVIVALLTLSVIVGFVLIGPWLVSMVGRGVARLSRGVPSLLAARRIAADPSATFYSVAAVGLAAAALTYVACTAATAGAVVGAAEPDRPSQWSPPPGIVQVYTGGVPESTVAPLLAEATDTDYGPGGIVRLWIPTDGSLAAENRVRTRAANLVPNAIINSSRDPVNQDLDVFFRDVDRLGAVAVFFIVIIGAFGLAASMVSGLIERQRPFALLRASGVHLYELRRAVLLETAATMAVTTAVATGVGMLLAYAAARQSGVDWRWPGWDLAAFLGGGVLAALLFSTIALPLLSLTTRHDAVRFE